MFDTRGPNFGQARTGTDYSAACTRPSCRTPAGFYGPLMNPLAPLVDQRSSSNQITRNLSQVLLLYESCALDADHTVVIAQ